MYKAVLWFVKLLARRGMVWPVPHRAIFGDAACGCVIADRVAS
jgi:hypothetical protein